MRSVRRGELKPREVSKSQLRYMLSLLERLQKRQSPEAAALEKRFHSVVTKAKASDWIDDALAALERIDK